MKNVYTNIRFFTSMAVMLLVLTSGQVMSQIDVVQDGGFEGGTPNNDWNETSTNFGTPICDFNSCQDCGGPCVPFSGSWYLWFGGIASLEIGSVDQSFTLPSNAQTAELKFWTNMAITHNHNLDTLKVLLDGNVLFSISNVDSNSYAGYTEDVIDVLSYCDGNSHTLTIWGYQDGAGITNMLVDDVSLVYTWPTGTGYNLLSHGVQIYPNPTADALFIGLNYSQATDLEIEIYDLQGTRVYHNVYQGVQRDKLNIPLHGIAAGTYMLKMNNQKNIVTRPIVVVK